MKRLFVTLAMMPVAFMTNAQSCPDSNHPHAIDLGLPSGTKWACCNVGATTPEGYGGYYAWGETEEKEIYNWTTYIHCDGSMETCHDLGSDIAGSEYDVAHVQWGGSWVMPSQEQIEELISKCSFTGMTKNGVDGGLFTGPNGGTIFLPAADIRWNGFLECLVLGGYYWSSTQSSYLYDAYRLCFDLSWGGGSGGNDRGHGLTVRPVIGETVGTPGIDHTPTVTIDGLLYKLSGTKHTAMVANGNVWEGELVIPEEVNYEGKTYTVDRIEWLAFDFCKTLTKVRIPKTVVDIRHYAQRDDCKNPFCGCTSLESIEVDEANPSMCSVDGVLFSKDRTQLYCYPAGAKRETYSVPDGVTWIGGDAFAYNSSLTSIYMSNSVTYMSFATFSNCKSLNSIRLSENIKYISAYTFENCESLHFLDFPESVMYFAESVFRWSPIKTIVIRGTFPEGLRSDTFYFMDDEVVIYVQPSEVDKFKMVFKGTVLPLNDWIEDDYRPFVEEGKIWKVGDTSVNPVQLVEYYYFDGDTIINGKVCKQMMCQRYYGPDYHNDAITFPIPALRYIGAWYEEDKKVYYYDINNQLKMMYNFALEANDTLLVDNEYLFVVGPKQTGGLKGFKGIYRDVLWCHQNGSSSYSTTWLEGVGSIDGPRNNVFYSSIDRPPLLMSCTVGDEVIYLNDEYEDGATPHDVMGARKNRFDFTHTIKTKPKAPRRSAEELSLYGEYNDLKLGINLNPLDDAYLVRITDESGKVVYEKAVNAGNIVGLNIDISAYEKGRYTVTVENSDESFTGEFEAQATGIEAIINNKVETRNVIYNLQGQRLSSLQKGLNIVNGQKIYVK